MTRGGARKGFVWATAWTGQPKRPATGKIFDRVHSLSWSLECRKARSVTIGHLACSSSYIPPCLAMLQRWCRACVQIMSWHASRQTTVPGTDAGRAVELLQIIGNDCIACQVQLCRGRLHGGRKSKACRSHVPPLLHVFLSVECISL